MWAEELRQAGLLRWGADGIRSLLSCLMSDATECLSEPRRRPTGGLRLPGDHGIGALKARWLPLARTQAERALFGRIRSALDPTATLNPNVLVH